MFFTESQSCVTNAVICRRDVKRKRVASNALENAFETALLTYAFTVGISTTVVP